MISLTMIKTPKKVKSSTKRSSMKLSKGTDYLGEQIDIVFDRPLGSVHPRHKDIIYPINYGFIPDTVAGDGHPIDVYYLSGSKPLKETTAICIGYVNRHNDNEDKLIATDGEIPELSKIEEMLDFQEKWFDDDIILMSEKKA